MSLDGTLAMPEGPPSGLDIIPGAPHLFEEPGCPDAVVDRARAWFLDHWDAEGR